MSDNNIKLHIKLLKTFFDLASNRKRLDNQFYADLIWMERFFKKKIFLDLITIYDNEYAIEMEKHEKLSLYIKSLDINILNNNEVRINNSGLIVNEFNLYWEKKLIGGNYRGWARKKTFIKCKNEFLNSPSSLEDLFYFNFMQEFDWTKSLNFISNRNVFKRQQTNSKDSFDRSYKIKNLLKELSTYDVLFKRKVECIDNAFCPRCEKEIENWMGTCMVL
jgi:hypothetical protein